MRALAKPGTHEAIARVLGKDSSQVSRMVNTERGIKLSELDGFLSTIGLGLTEVGGESVTISRAEYDALKLFAAKHLLNE